MRVLNMLRVMNLCSKRSYSAYAAEALYFTVNNFCQILFEFNASCYSSKGQLFYCYCILWSYWMKHVYHLPSRQFYIGPAKPGRVPSKVYISMVTHRESRQNIGFGNSLVCQLFFKLKTLFLTQYFWFCLVCYITQTNL